MHAPLYTAICLLLVAFTSTGCALIAPRPVVRFEGNAVTIQYKDDLEGFHRKPVIEGSIDGVRGKFLIDTGADGPMLTMEAVRRCHIPLSAKTKSVAFEGAETPERFRRISGKVTIDLGGITVTWGDVAVFSGFGNERWLGLIDYRTLQAAHAVIDVTAKTIRFSP